FPVPHFPVGKALNRKMWDRKMAASGSRFSSILRFTQKRDGHPLVASGLPSYDWLKEATL
ncbi:MAG: hypothetical protein ACREAM_29025, partial [Blastocatellia bacterium]